jgi:hypothetical protein
MRKRVYIETSIPSFYVETRTEADVIARRVMPKDPRGDALHLALASYHHCHFLLTWNCRHLANAAKFEHIRHVNSVLGLFSPILTTPFELLEFREDDLP